MNETSFNSMECDTRCCLQNLVVLYEGEEVFQYLQYHAQNYQKIHKHISITLQSFKVSEGENIVPSLLEDNGSWDGAVFRGHMTGVLMEANLLWNWNDYLVQQQTSTEGIQWTDILPFHRSQAQQTSLSTKSSPSLGLLRSSSSPPLLSSPDAKDRNDGMIDRLTLYVPLDGDVLVLLYRKDLFDRYNVTVPRTWDDYKNAAAFFHGKPWGPNNTTMIGSCVPRKRDRCPNNINKINSYWASLVLSTMTQTKGTSSGFLLDPETVEPILGNAMKETLRILEEEVSLGHSDELHDCTLDNSDLEDSATKVDQSFGDGNCALTYGWVNPFTAEIRHTPGAIGVAPTPGSTRVYNRETGKLEVCTATLCPYGTYYDDIGIVNRPAYSASGGWVAGVSNRSAPNSKHAMADFFSYISNQAQSLPDALSKERSKIVGPFRYSHTRASDWRDAGFDDVAASQITEIAQKVNSENTVSEIRIRPGSMIREILDQEVYDFLSTDSTHRDTIERARVTESIDARIREAVSQLDTAAVIKNYQSSLGYSKPFIYGDSMNYIDPNYRDTGWAVAVLICFMSLMVVLWVFLKRNNKVMRAFQPFLVIQSAMGLFFMAATLIPVGFDDSLFSIEVLNVSCMVAPWVYTFGFTIFFASIYSKIQSCTNIYKNPGKYDRMTIRPKDSLIFFLKFFAVNAVILGLWTFLDPLKWYRLEKTANGPTFPSPDGTVETYGSCRSERFNYLGFAVGLYAYNMTLCFLAMLQALKCRDLVLEYQQMQWLQLCILPFFEAWIIGGPVLTLISERPTTQYVVIVIMIASSSIAAALIIFAPEEWYIRKHYLRSLNDISERMKPAYPLGIRVIKHPKLESQKHVLNLQKKLVHCTASNTELSIDIRVLHEKFRLLTEKEKLEVVRGMLAKEASDSEIFRIKDSMSEQVDLFDSNSVGRPRRNSASLQMPPDDEEKKMEVIAGFPQELSDTSSIYSKIAEGTDEREGAKSSSTPSKIVVTLRDSTQEEKPRHRSVNPEFQKRQNSSITTISNGTDPIAVEHNDDPDMQVQDDLMFDDDAIPQADLSKNNSTESTSRNNQDLISDDMSQGEIKGETSTPKLYDQIEELDDMIVHDCLEGLESKAMMMAEQFKLNKTFLESISDIQQNIDDKEGTDLKDEGFEDLDISKITRAPSSDDSVCTTPGDNSDTAGVDLFPSASAGESSGTHVVACENALKLEDENDSMQQNPGEPSSDRSLSIAPKLPSGAASNIHGVKRDSASDSLPATAQVRQHQKMPTRDQECGTTSTIHSSGSSSSTPFALAPESFDLELKVGETASRPQLDTTQVSDKIEGNSVSIEGWTAAGKLGNILSHGSDSTSSSSYGESAEDSDSSVVIKSSTSQSNMVDELLDKSDFDDVKGVAGLAKANADVSTDEGEKSRLIKMSTTRQKKRELEAMLGSFLRSNHS